MESTPASLIFRLRHPEDHSAWDRFVRLFVPMLDSWARRIAGQSADADDLVQDTFAVLVRELPRFTYHPNRSFRAWLWTIMRHAWIRRQEKAQPVLRPEHVLETQLVEDGEPPFDEQEYRDHLVGLAVKLMRADFAETTWKACWEMVAHDRPAAEVAVQFNMSVNAVYQAKVRVLSRLRQELDGLWE